MAAQVPHYAIMRFAKYKGPEISNIEAHNERTKETYASNPDIDPTRTRLNFHLIEPQDRYRAESNRQIKEAGCRTRSDSLREKDALRLLKRLYPLWCIWTRKLPICTFVLSLCPRIKG